MNVSCACVTLVVNRVYLFAGHHEVDNGRLVILDNGWIIKGKKIIFLDVQRWQRRLRKLQRRKNRLKNRTRRGT